MNWKVKGAAFNGIKIKSVNLFFVVIGFNGGEDPKIRAEVVKFEKPVKIDGNRYIH